jgi:hypothetical protein
MFQAKVVEKIKTRILSQITFFENRSDSEIMPKNMVKQEVSQMTSQHDM